MDLELKRILSRVLFGKPIPTHDAPDQTISKSVGLAVFASDALSSVAYATQEILLVLAAAGMAHFNLSLPISAVIIGLLVILTISYRQTIFAYPGGGGAYIVSRDNLGEAAGPTAGAALLMDYILTVAVSISSGVDQIVSVFPHMLPYQVPLCLVILCFMMLMNLRGVKESGNFFAFPTYFFIITSFLTVGVGFYKYLTGSLAPIEGVEMMRVTAEPLTLFLILRAFSSGCTALTGVEAISNGITAFKEPKSRNAANTMTIMSVILGILFIGITFLAYHIHAVPSDAETIISQLGRSIFGRGLMYRCLMGATTVILVMAANTSFADFPRLCALHAGDGFLPRQLTYRSGRLVFSWGIVFLSAAAGGLIFLFQAHTSSLIPLYAIGVFLSFTLSQFGMVVRWRKFGRRLREEHHIMTEEDKKTARGWHWKQAINFVGAVASCVVMFVFAITKFMYGAWVTVILIPMMVLLFFRIHAHYKRVARFLTLPPEPVLLKVRPMTTIILIDDIHTGTVKMVEFAKTLGHPWFGLHVDYDEERGESIKQKWNQQINEGELTMITSPFRLLMEPILEFIIKERNKTKDGFVHVITGQLVVRGTFGPLLHSKNARGLFDELQKIERVIVTGVPYQLERRNAARPLS